LLSCPAYDVLFGGARGGGKSDALLGDWIAHQWRNGASARGLLVRRSMPELEEIKSRSREIYTPLRAEYHEQRSSWTFPNGATLRLRYLDRDADAEKYQGHGYTWLGIDEMGNFPSPAPIDKLRATLRSAAGVPVCIRASANPGGVGHNWVKARYIDPVPPMTPFQPDELHGATRVFIPSRVEDNRLLIENDPGYVNRIRESGPEWLVRAWLEGDWSITAGGYFDDIWRPAVHEVEPFRIPTNWRVDRAYDHGSSRPYAALWFAESNGENAPNGRTYPKGSVFVVGEEYGWNGKPNEGLRLSNTEVARRIVDTEKALRNNILEGHTVRPGPADNMIFDVDDGRSVADEMAKVGVRWERSNKGKGSRVTGWQMIRQMLAAGSKQPIEDPALFVFKTCRNTIRTLPSLPRDERNPDDVDTNAEDHIGDVIRYRLLTEKREMRSLEITGH
jgi:hypothetical protein